MPIQEPQDTIRLLVFTLAGYDHAVDLRCVRKILIAPEISPLLEAPVSVEGVIQLRGRTVPIVNLRKRLRLPDAPKTYETCILALEVDRRMVGLLVDSASELLTVPTARIEPPTQMIGGVRTRFIAGVAWLPDRFLVLLDLETVLTLDDEEILPCPDAAQRGNLPACPALARPEATSAPSPPEVSAGWDEALDARRESHLRRIVAFELDGELYGAEIEDVAEILEMVPITPLPNVPEHIVGLINLRGTIVPVINRRLRVVQPGNARDRENRILVLQAQHLLVGMLVDRVWELLRLSARAFQPPPPDVAGVAAPFVKEVSPLHDRLLLVLDVPRMLTDTACRVGVPG